MVFVMVLSLLVVLLLVAGSVGVCDGDAAASSVVDVSA